MSHSGWEELTALPQIPKLDFRGLLLRGGRERKGKERVGREKKRKPL